MDNIIRYPAMGLGFSRLSFGTALTIGVESIDKSRNKELIEEVYSKGIRIFDTSNNYGEGQSEIELGLALEQYGRSNYILKSKVGWNLENDSFSGCLSRKHILDQIYKSLTRLKTNFIDIYYAHRFDVHTPLEEVAHTFNFLIDQGLIRYWGTSQWSLEQLNSLYKICERYGYHKPVVEQFIFNPIINDSLKNGVHKQLLNNGSAMFGFSPLCQGILTGKYSDGKIPLNSRIGKSTQIGYAKTTLILNERKVAVQKYLDFCNSHSVKPEVIALLWSLRKSVIPVIGASSPEQLNYIDYLDKYINIMNEEFWLELEGVL